MALRPVYRGLAAALATLTVVVVQAELYSDGACPIFALLPFTTRYVRCPQRALVALLDSVFLECDESNESPFLSFA